MPKFLGESILKPINEIWFGLHLLHLNKALAIALEIWLPSGRSRTDVLGTCIPFSVMLFLALVT